MQRTTMGAFAAVLLAACLLATPAAAHERTLTIETEDGSRVEIRSESAVANGEVDFKFRARQPEDSNRPRLAVAAERETENGTIEEELEVEFAATFREVFEFEDANGNGVQDGTEPRLSTIRLETLTYDPLDIADRSVEGVTGFQVTIQGTREGFTFRLVATVLPADAHVNGTLVPEQAVKVDIVLEGYPFESPTSLLGLEVGAESTIEQEMEFEDEDRSVEVSTQRGTAFFRWEPEAIVDGQSRPVHSQWRADGQRLVLFYPHGDSIVHDPLLGFDLGSNAWPTVAVLGGVGIGAAAIGIFALRRRKTA